jgi:hypothetical protein
MQEGIGRSGYRVIALVFFGLGVLGLATSLYDDQPSGLGWLGFFLTAIATLALLVLSLTVLATRVPPSSVVVPAGVLEPQPDLMPTTAAADPGADLGVEYDDFDVQPIQLGEASTRSTAPPEQPRAPIVVPPRKPQGDTKGWPQRRDPTGMTRGDLRKQKEQPQFEPPTRDPPLVMARTAASAEATGIPDNVSLGKCGNCGVLLLAPRRRPIRLQCPRCERVHTMT